MLLFSEYEHAKCFAVMFWLLQYYARVKERFEVFQQFLPDTFDVHFLFRIILRLFPAFERNVINCIPSSPFLKGQGNDSFLFQFSPFREEYRVAIIAFDNFTPNLAHMPQKEWAWGKKYSYWFHYKEQISRMRKYANSLICVLWHSDALNQN